MSDYKQYKEPTMVQFIVYAVVMVGIVMITFPMMGLPWIAEFIVCFIIGWTARVTLNWLRIQYNTALIKLYDWSQK